MIVFLALLPFFNSMLDLIPTIEIHAYEGYLNQFVEYLSFATYIIPLDKLMPIITIVIGLTVIRAIIALARMIMDIIPIL